jgi:hypothetical protein
MKVGVSVPITEIGDDFGALRDYIQAAEDMGYDHVRILDRSARLVSRVSGREPLSIALSSIQSGTPARRCHGTWRLARRLSNPWISA